MERKKRSFKHLSYRDRVKIEMMLMEKRARRKLPMHSV